MAATRVPRHLGRSSGPVVFSVKRGLLVIAIGALLPLLIAYAVQPSYASWIGNRFSERARTALVAGDFVSAQSDANQAITYAKRAADTQAIAIATELAELSKKGSTDPEVLRDFWVANNAHANLDRLQFAQEQLDDPVVLVQRAESLRQSGFAAYGQYSAIRATEIAAEYPDGWDHLSVIYDELAGSDPVYSAKAAAARQRRDVLTPRWLAQ
jgi:hypothetical protein